MDLFQLIAERKIKEAIEAGVFDDLPKGKQIDLEVDGWIPEDLRMAYKILKNAGYVPEEIELKKDINSLRCLLNTIDDEQLRLKKIRELNFKILKLNELRKRPFSIDDFPEYEHRLIDRLIKQSFNEKEVGQPGGKNEKAV